MSKIRRVDYSPDEFLAGIRGMALDEVGAYWIVCSLMYSRGGPIADDDPWIAKACGCHWRVWRRLKARLLGLGKLRITPEGLVNGRAQIEIMRAQERLKSSARASQESVTKRSQRAHDAEQSNDYNDIPEAGAHFSGRAINQLPTTKGMKGENQTEIPNRENLPVTTVHGKTSKHGRRATRLPDDWQVSDSLRTWTIEKIRAAKSSVSGGHELEAFRDHWKAAPDDKGMKNDWDATWRNWIREAIRRSKGNGQRSSNDSSGKLGAGARAAVSAEILRRGHSQEPDQRGGRAEPVDVGSASLVSDKK